MRNRRKSRQLGTSNEDNPEIKDNNLISIRKEHRIINKIT